MSYCCHCPPAYLLSLAGGGGPARSLDVQAEFDAILGNLDISVLQAVGLRRTSIDGGSQELCGQRSVNRIVGYEGYQVHLRHRGGSGRPGRQRFVTGRVLVIGSVPNRYSTGSLPS
jgi:hypothetical protein